MRLAGRFLYGEDREYTRKYPKRAHLVTRQSLVMLVTSGKHWDGSTLNPEASRILGPLWGVMEEELVAGP